MPAAMKPPKTKTITSRLTGSAMPSPTRRSISTWWLMSLTSKGTPLARAVAPGTGDRAAAASRWIRSIAASWAALSSPGSERRGDQEPTAPRTPIRTAPVARRRWRAGPPGTRNGDCTGATSGVADTRCCSVLAAVRRPPGRSRRPRRPARAPGPAPVLAPADSRSWPVLDSPGTLGSPEDRRSNSDSPVTPPTAVANASTTATSHDPDDPAGAPSDERAEAVHRGRGGGAVPRRTSSHAG